MPIGAYAYSQGLETAVDRGWVTSEEGAKGWIIGVLEHSVSSLDLPVLARSYDAWQQGDAGRARHWSQRLLASRESAETLAEDRHLGGALAAVLVELGVSEAAAWVDDRDASYVCLFSLAASTWKLPMDDAASSYAYAWAEHQIAAATRLIPLGQLAAQRVLAAALQAIPPCVERALRTADDDIGSLAPGQAVASAWHEAQYSRLFRS